jgi:hypothetical protein
MSLVRTFAAFIAFGVTAMISFMGIIVIVILSVVVPKKNDQTLSLCIIYGNIKDFVFSPLITLFINYTLIVCILNRKAVFSCLKKVVSYLVDDNAKKVESIFSEDPGNAAEVNGIFQETV